MFTKQFVIKNNDGSHFICWGTVEDWEKEEPEIFEEGTLISEEEWTVENLIEMFGNVLEDVNMHRYTNIADLVLSSLRKVNKLTPQEEKEVVKQFIIEFSKVYHLSL